MSLFKAKKKYIRIKPSDYMGDDTVSHLDVPEDMFKKCPHCKNIIYAKDMGDEKVCPCCGYNFRLSSKERLDNICDEGTFVPFNEEIEPKKTFDFPDYEKKLEKAKENTGINEAVVTGFSKIGGIDTAIAVMDAGFIMGSMGIVVGEKITLLFEEATKRKLPVIIFAASGGARMQEGIFSLMQMAKISFAVRKHSEAGLLYVSVLTDPTTGGVTASFAMDGDIILAEPGTLVGFAGRRVIEQTMKSKLPKDFQSAEFVLEHGFIDKIVKRDELKDTLWKILKLHGTL
ncbi:MAG: acetyl-CoA carboxylase, carboxyltransferase subunit beta [Lachnospiraceae bacterium]|jgi:acetyl-CoA carboxylase carboxyl transferase subunit beta|nr:acetyl-CoA carboxylase, carboxyltransferase subunit beta [Lachnospiraceae bacterium]